MRIALAIVCLLACLALGACGGGGGDADGGIDDPQNRWDQMDWNEGEWA